MHKATDGALPGSGGLGTGQKLEPPRAHPTGTVEMTTEDGLDFIIIVLDVETEDGSRHVFR